MNNSNLSKNTTVEAIRTNEGFIEITSLELLDEMVGGLISPETALCQLKEEHLNTTKHYSADGIK
ncbi:MULTISPECIES: hypothetical protein [unclassified Pseudoalteromonas]|uniref:hypothetical protein n=1 Tax=unclassified Pseudoalteromonas TaxID=194690 RepID=UPI0005A6FF18|nr:MULTISPECIES: hypothetical protein [unclassified Pseudoalteromonas]